MLSLAPLCSDVTVQQLHVVLSCPLSLGHVTGSVSVSVLVWPLNPPAVRSVAVYQATLASGRLA